MIQNKTIKVRMNALVHRLQINKNIRFQTRILWKRHTNKTQTRLVNHEHGYSTFEESVFLDLNMKFDEAKQCFEEKKTEIVAVIMYQEKVKSGGYAKYDMSQIINNNLDSKPIKIPLTQCPDPKANLEITFTYEYLEEGFSDAMSVLNASSRDLNMSRIDFHDDKMSLEMDRINSTITKLGQLADNVKAKAGKSNKTEFIIKIQQLQGENKTLKDNMSKLEKKLEAKEKENTERSKQDNKTIRELQKQIDQRDKDYRSRQFIELDEEKQLKQQLALKQKESEEYKRLYQQAKAERGGTSKVAAGVPVKDSAEITRLKEENSVLQNQVARESFRIAQLFNTAFEFGGGKLVDELQKAIGLTQKL